MRTLDPPDEVLQSTQRQEVFRAWIDGGMLSTSVSSVFPEDYRDEHSEIWAMLISDIFHHVVDAIVLETERERDEVQAVLTQAFKDVVDSKRGSRFGNLKTFPAQLEELPDPDVSGDDDCVEIVRIALLPDSIRVMVHVGMWLPDEEDVWGNILYDIAFMIASSMRDSDSVDSLRDCLIQDVFHYIANPSSEYSGEYYNTEQGAADQLPARGESEAK